MRKKGIYVLYKGETYITDGTIEEIANELNISVKTVYDYGTARYQKRGKKNLNRRILVKIGKEGQEYYDSDEEF